MLRLKMSLKTHTALLEPRGQETLFLDFPENENPPIEKKKNIYVISNIEKYYVCLY